MQNGAILLIKCLDLNHILFRRKKNSSNYLQLLELMQENMALGLRFLRAMQKN